MMGGKMPFCSRRVTAGATHSHELLAEKNHSAYLAYSAVIILLVCLRALRPHLDAPCCSSET